MEPSKINKKLLRKCKHLRGIIYLEMLSQIPSLSPISSITVNNSIKAVTRGYYYFYPVISVVDTPRVTFMTYLSHCKFTRNLNNEINVSCPKCYKYKKDENKLIFYY